MVLQRIGSIAALWAVFIGMGARVSFAQSEDTIPRRHAVVIGIDHYYHLADKNQLRYAGKDADDFAKFLESPSGGSVDISNIQVLSQNEVKHQAIDRALTWLNGVCKKGDEAVIFWSGHGALEESPISAGYLITSEYDPELGTGGPGAYPMSYITEEIEDLMNAGVNVLLVVDACHSGDMSRLSYQVLQAFGAANPCENHGRLTMFLGCKTTEEARERNGNGILTRVLINGLRGAADDELKHGEPVKYYEIESYVKKEFDHHFPDQSPTVEKVCTSDRTIFSYVDSVVPREDYASFEQSSRDVASRAPDVSVHSGLEKIPEVSTLESLLQADAVDLTRDSTAWELWKRIEVQSSSILPSAASDLKQTLAYRLASDGQETMNLYLRDGDKTASPEVYRAAQLAMQRARELFGEDHPLSRVLRTKELFLGALAMLLSTDRTKLDSCRELLLQVLDREPEAGYAYEALGQVHFYRSEYHDASVCYREAARLAPEWNLPRQDLAQVPIEVHEWKLAKRRLDALMARNDTSTMTLMIMGQYFSDLANKYHSIDSAQFYFRKALEYAAPSSTYSTWVARYLAEIFKESGHKEEAINAFQNAVREHPDYSKYYISWSQIFKDAATPNYDSAIDILRIGHSKFPRDAAICEELGGEFLLKFRSTQLAESQAQDSILVAESRANMKDSIAKSQDSAATANSPAGMANVAQANLISEIPANSSPETLRDSTQKTQLTAAQYNRYADSANYYYSMSLSLDSSSFDPHVGFLSGAYCENDTARQLQESESIERLGGRSESGCFDAAIGYWRIGQSQQEMTSLIQGASLYDPECTQDLSKYFMGGKVTDSLRFAKLADAQFKGVPIFPSLLGIPSFGPRASIPSDSTNRGRAIRKMFVNQNAGELLFLYGPTLDSEHVDEIARDVRTFYPDPADGMLRLVDAAASQGKDGVALMLLNRVLTDTKSDVIPTVPKEYGENLRYQIISRGAELCYRVGLRSYALELCDTLLAGHLQASQAKGVRFLKGLVLLDSGMLDAAGNEFNYSGNSELGTALIEQKRESSSDGVRDFKTWAEKDDSWKHFDLYRSPNGPDALPRYGFSKSSLTDIEKIVDRYSTTHPNDSVGVFSTLTLSERYIFSRFGTKGLHILRTIDGQKTYDEIRSLAHASDDDIDDVVEAMESVNEFVSN